MPQGEKRRRRDLGGLFRSGAGAGMLTSSPPNYEGDWRRPPRPPTPTASGMVDAQPLFRPQKVIRCSARGESEVAAATTWRARSAARNLDYPRRPRSTTQASCTVLPADGKHAFVRSASRPGRLAVA